NQTNAPSVSLIGSTIVVTQGNNYSSYLSVMASLNLFEGGQGIENLAASHMGVTAGREQVAEQRMRTALNVLAGYEGLQSLQWQLQALKRSLAFMEQDLALTEQRVREGNQSQINLNQMQSQIANLESQRQDTERRLTRAQTNLALLLGKNGAFDLVQSGVHNSIPSPPGFDAAAVADEAVENLPSVQVARSALHKARDHVDAVRGSFLPDVNLQAGYNWIGTSSHGFGRALGGTAPSNYTVGVSITQTLAPFTGHLAKLDTAEAQSEAALIRYQRALQQGRQQLRVNREELRAGAARLAALTSIYARARQNQKLMEDLYVHGRISKTELHAAQIKTLNAQDACRDARAQLQVARWMLYAMVDPQHLADSLLRKTLAEGSGRGAPSSSGAGAEHA
ncbi:MAG: TolC family protein, partial [Acidithiobacillus ferrivorans]